MSLNDHHNSLLLNYLRFAKFQRGQCLRQFEDSFEDAKTTRLNDDTYTVDEVAEILTDVASIVRDDIESELINSAHTNVLLLQQVFEQAQKWHLNLDADLAELENRELLDKVKLWEESELSAQSMMEKPHLSPKKTKLAPLNEGGPVQLLNAQIKDLNEENEKLKARLRSLEESATSALSAKADIGKQLEEERQKFQQEAALLEQKGNAQASNEVQKEREELSAALASMKFQMSSEQEMNAKTQKELETDLTSTKHQLLEVQHHLNMAEKELELKFSQTGAYKNLKKMLSSKNDQIKKLRAKVKELNGGADDDDDEE